MKKNNLTASFRDPSGFVFKQNNQILRQVNVAYKRNYDLLFSSGLYDHLVNQKWLISHQEIKSSLPLGAYKIIAPQEIPFITYPYEWSFSQLKDAALLTLEIQKESIKHGMTLKDATSFNIQYFEGKPILIDTLSFEKYVEGDPWIAYKQFCEQFLAPLAVYSQVDIRLNSLLQANLGNIPLDLTAKLLPKAARLNFSLLIHIFLHSRSQNKYAGKAIKTEKNQSFSKNSLLGLIDSLQSAISTLHLKKEKTVWNTYYDDNNNYTSTSFKQKESLVAKFLKQTEAKVLWDIGANSGNFSKIASGLGIKTISIDNDIAVVEQNYLQIKKDGEKNILPLYQDITNPTPAIGWQNDERTSFLSRSSPDCILALALIHHLAIASNLPFEYIATFFSNHCKYLIIEFVPKEDSQVKILLQQRVDIFPSYTQSEFEQVFSQSFKIIKKNLIEGTKRTLYLMESK